MNGRINIEKEVAGDVDSVVERVTTALSTHGFGVLTRIDLDTKIQEKTGKKVPWTVILGACNPQMAYEAFTATPDVASLLPCNAVIREVGPKRVTVAFARPTTMMQLLGDASLDRLAQTADERLGHALEAI